MAPGPVGGPSARAISEVNGLSITTATQFDQDDEWEAQPGLLDAARRHWWLVVLGLALGVGAGVGLSQLQPTRYTASSELLLSNPNRPGALSEEVSFVDPQRNLENQAQRMTSGAVLSRAAADLGESLTVEALRGSVQVEASPQIDVLIVSATAADPALAAEIANAVVRAYEAVVRRDIQDAAEEAVAELEEAVAQTQRRLEAIEERLEDEPDSTVLRGQADGLIRQIGTLEARIEQITVNASLRGSGVEYVEQAVPPRGPSHPRPRRNAAAGGVLGIAVAVAGAWLLEGRRRSADDVQDAAAVLRAPLLGTVPDFRDVGVSGDLPVLTDPRSAAAEAYHLVVLSIQASLPDDGGRGAVILVTSAEPGDGKTVTAMNLAIAAGHGDRDVALVDGDARMRGLSRLAGRNGDQGLMELQEAEDVLSWWEYRYAIDGTDGLEFVPAGGHIDDPPSFFQSSGFERVVQRFRDHADITLIDSPPLLAVSDTLAIARQVDAIVFVVRRGISLDALTEARRQLAFVEAPVLGYIVNRVDTRHAPYAAYSYDPPDIADSSAEPEEPPTWTTRT